MTTSVPPATSHSAGGQRLRIGVIANFTAQPTSESLEFWFRELQIFAAARFSPHDQVLPELLNPGGFLRRECDYAVVLLQLERWGGPPGPESGIELRRNVHEFAAAARAAAESGAPPMLVVLCPPTPRLLVDSDNISAEQTMLGALEDLPGIEVVSNRRLQELYPPAEQENQFDDYANTEWQVPYSRVCFARIGTVVARWLYRNLTPPRKVVVTDCDNTLWSGLCGEDGPDNVVIGPGRLGFQNSLRRLGAQGFLLCLCSKNDEQAALDVFERHPDMVLRKADFAAWRINWSAKAENLRTLAAELSLGLDSFVFIDDDAFECAAVRSLCPQVVTLHFPTDEAQQGTFLQGVWELDPRPQTAEDRQRAGFYRQNAERSRASQECSSLKEFLQRLELRLELLPLREDNLARAAQLTERTNQFNLNGLKRSISDLRAVSARTEGLALLIRANDRFGDYGVIGFVVGQRTSKDFRIDTFVLSCRALGRGVEEQVLSRLFDAGRQSGAKALSFSFRPTGKNHLVEAFLRAQGATQHAGEWVFSELDRVSVVDSLGERVPETEVRGSPLEPV